LLCDRESCAVASSCPTLQIDAHLTMVQKCRVSSFLRIIKTSEKEPTRSRPSSTIPLEYHQSLFKVLDNLICVRQLGLNPSPGKGGFMNNSLQTILTLTPQRRCNRHRRPHAHQLRPTDRRGTIQEIQPRATEAITRGTGPEAKGRE